MNIECGCYGTCKQALQVGDPDSSVSVLTPLRIFGCTDGKPTVWLDPGQITTLIEALMEAKTARLEAQAKAAKLSRND